MSTKKSGGSTKNIGGSQPKYLGVKLYSGQTVSTGMVIVRQRGTKILAGNNVGIGKDHTLFALKDGIISFKDVRKTTFEGKMQKRKRVEVV